MGIREKIRERERDVQHLYIYFSANRSGASECTLHPFSGRSTHSPHLQGDGERRSGEPERDLELPAWETGGEGWGEGTHRDLATARPDRRLSSRG